MRGSSRSNPFQHTLDFPYRIGHRRGRRTLPEDPATLKAIQRIEGHLAHRRDVEARRIASEAVKHLGLDDDKPL